MPLKNNKEAFIIELAIITAIRHEVNPLIMEKPD